MIKYIYPDQKVFFNEPEVTEYLRCAVGYANFKSDLNDNFPPKNEDYKARIQRFFNLPQEFVDTFTERWTVLVITQSKESGFKHYHLHIVSNGRLSELELITHMFSTAEEGEPTDFRMYEEHSYDDYDQIPLAMFNIICDNLIAIQFPLFGHYQRRLMQEDLTDFYRSLQYMMLYYYIEPFQLGYTLYHRRLPWAPQPD